MHAYLSQEASRMLSETNLGVAEGVGMVTKNNNSSNGYARSGVGGAFGYAAARFSRGMESA